MEVPKQTSGINSTVLSLSTLSTEGNDGITLAMLSGQGRYNSSKASG